MTDDFDNLHSQYGFEADGRPVPSVAPDIYFDDPLPPPASEFDLESFLDCMLLGVKNRTELADNILILAFRLKRVTRGPKTFAELGRWMGVTGTTAKARLEAKKAVFIKQFQHLLESTPISED